MIIEGASPLRRLPAALDRRQALFLDSIRYSIEMADIAHVRLRKTLFEISTSDAADTEQRHLLTVSSILDAWSIVDSVHRLRALVRRMPGLKKSTAGARSFMRQVEEVEVLRNAVQHLDTELDRRVEANLPAWGVLTWIAVVGEQRAAACALISGSIAPAQQVELPNPAGRTVEVPVDSITLSASGRSVCLSKVMRAVQTMVRQLEPSLSEQFGEHSQGAADLFVATIIGFEPPEPGEQSTG